MFNARDLAGLTALSAQSFQYRSNAISLSGLGRASDPPVTASFSYDDTAFGAVPDGILKTLASCAVAASPYSGEYVQLTITDAIRALGHRPYLFGSSPVGLNVTAGGQITAFSVGMPGTLDLADLPQCNAAGGLVTVASELPITVSSLGGPAMMLLRPTALTWPGQDPANEANRTIWKVGEVAKAAIGFSVSGAQALDSQITLTATGWQ